MVEKANFPVQVQENINKFIDIIEETGFFNDPLEIPQNYVDVAKTHMWNFVGEHYLQGFLNGDENHVLSQEQATYILSLTIVQTNLDSLKDLGFIDGVENENGEMVYFTTEKGKDLLN